MIKYWLKMFVIVVINLTIPPPPPPKLHSCPQSCDPFGQHHESKALAEDKTGSPIKTDFQLSVQL